jgi:hypothetical protein
MTLTQTQHQTVSTWIARTPSIVAGIAAVAIIATTLLSWPTRPNVPTEETTSGIIVAVRAAEVTGNTDIVIYGFRLPDGTQVFSRVAIYEQGAHPGYAWFGASAGQDIQVAYNTSDPEDSIPYRGFPIWTTISWAVIYATFAYIVAMLVTKRVARLAIRRETPLPTP